MWDVHNGCMNTNNWLDAANSIIVAIGVPATVGGLIYIGKKIQVLDDLKITVDKIKHNVTVIINFLMKNAPNFDSTELRDYSPLGLTIKGTGLVGSIGFDRIFCEHKNDFFACIDDEEPELKYDVEILAIRSIYCLSEKPYMKFLKVYLYNNPTRTIDNVAPTLGVYVRDKYLTEHPGIVE